MSQCDRPVFVDGLECAIGGIEAGQPQDPDTDQQHGQESDHENQPRLDTQICQHFNYSFSLNPDRRIRDLPGQHS
ncbi:hypothetical protein SDC9_193932 [bioreactor metagenome]|uniref:Uncharacterized protein n=1 Tax=bioreactor metagenome TaxID=1076179 RepID=A0A645I628_9ZZZZ